MQSFHLVILLLISSSYLAQEIDVEQEQCLSNCINHYPFVYNRPSPCCGCCYNCSGQQCFEIDEKAFCCNKRQSFCGCLSSRASCLGINNSFLSLIVKKKELIMVQIVMEVVLLEHVIVKVLEKLVVVCFNLFYLFLQNLDNPSANSWILCPPNHTCCPSSNFYSCCDFDEECVSTSSSQSPICQKKR